MQFGNSHRDTKAPVWTVWLRERRFRLSPLIGLLLLTAVALAAPRIKAFAGAQAPRVLAVGTAESFQAALREAQPGDTIEIDAGARLVGNFELPEKRPMSSANGMDWITVRTATPDGALPPPTARVTPAFAGVLAQIASPNAQPALSTAAGANHYRLIGIEFTIIPDVRLNYGIVRLGDGDETDPQLLPHDLAFDRCFIHGTALADVSRGLALNSASTEITNCYISEIHGIGFDTQAICGWNGPGPFRIVNNYLEAAGENVLFGGADPTIAGLVPSDIDFRQNDCSKPLAWKDGILARPVNIAASALSSGMNNLLAGSTSYYRIAARARAGFDTTATSAVSDEVAIPLGIDQNAVSLSWDAVPFATEYRVFRTTDAPSAVVRNWVYYTSASLTFTDLADPLTASAGTPPEQPTHWSVKNVFELKNVRRIVVDGNTFENNWVDAQSGFAILFTVRNQDGKAPWATVEDVTFTNNVVRHSAAGINVLGKDNLQPSQQSRNLLVRNNLFYDIGAAVWGKNGRFLQISEAIGVAVDRNTVLQTGNIITAYGVPTTGFMFSNNLVPNNDYGVIGDGTASGNATIAAYLPACTFKRNAIIGGPAGSYPKNNLFPASVDAIGFVDTKGGDFRLSQSSPLRGAGTKGRDIGADIDAIDRAHRPGTR